MVGFKEIVLHRGLNKTAHLSNSPSQEAGTPIREFVGVPTGGIDNWIRSGGADNSSDRRVDTFVRVCSERTDGYVIKSRTK